MIIAVIPARGGSERIPQKNIRDFCGRPMIEYSISAAQESKLFDRIVVSTDCERIADIARQCGAEVPFVRPPELSDDRTPTIPVIRHAIQWFNSQGLTPDYVGCIYATAPFLLASDLQVGFKRLSADPTADFLFPVTTFPFSIFRAVTIEDNRVNMIWPEHELTRSQDLPEAFHDAGQFYFGTTAAWQNRNRIFSANSLPLVVPRHRVQDIDTLEDWSRAERMFQALRC